MRYVKTLQGRYQQVTDEQLRAMRYIPKNALPVTEDAALGVVYVYPVKGKEHTTYGAIGYRGTAGKADFHYTFKTDAKLDEHIANWFQGIRDYKKLVADRRVKDFAGHTFQVGDIVTNSWGYDQTNVDWYTVTRTTKNYVWLRPVASELVSATGAMSGVESLRLDENLKPIVSGEETKHRASESYVTMKHGCGSKWDGRKLHSSWYA